MGRRGGPHPPAPSPHGGEGEYGGGGDSGPPMVPPLRRGTEIPAFAGMTTLAKVSLGGNDDP